MTAVPPERPGWDYLGVEDLLDVAELTLASPILRDAGLLASAVARPQATVLGDDDYPTLALKAAALLQSLVGNHAWVDGNKRVGWVATVAFCGQNGCDVVAPEVDAYDLVVAVAAGEMRDIAAIAEKLTPWLTSLQ